jgi:hypothetical protein
VILEEINPKKLVEIMPEELISFFVGNEEAYITLNASRTPSNLSGGSKEEVIRLFEQIISSHRRI